MTDKLMYTGTTHSTGGPDGGARSIDGSLDIRMAEPHPAAENLFAAAWSACFIGALGVAAGMKKIALPQSPAIDMTIDLLSGTGGYFLRARIDASLPGVDRDVANELIHTAHEICPYSKAIAGNVDVTLNLV